MGGDLEQCPLWGIATYFNPSGYESRHNNYLKFRRKCHAQGLPLITVEVVPESGKAKLEVGRDAERLIHKTSSALIWHKERLLNIGLEALPDQCRYVAWLDADIVFEDDDWVERSIAELERHRVIQPFEKVIRLPRGKSPEQFPSYLIDSRIRRGRRTGNYTPSFCARYSAGKPVSGGTTGYAWGARRSLIEKHGFYDRCILGGADRELALAFAYRSDAVPHSELRIRSAKLRRHIASWRDAVYSDVGGDISFLKGTIYHLWHGDIEHRNYEKRQEILEQNDFDPENDIELDENGCWRFAPHAERLRLDVADYLASRREDG